MLSGLTGGLDLPHGFKRWKAIEEVERCIEQLGEEWQGQTALQAQLVDRGLSVLSGYCAVCRQPSRFSIERGADPEPNWRETLLCDGCGLINRWRASLHLLRLLPRPAGKTYITEQTTPLFDRLERCESELTGSEYLAADAAPGERRLRSGRELRHEDVTALSFGSGSLAAVLSFDVLEHVPDYRKAVGEFARVLAEGGLLLLTAPFLFQSRETLVRARIAADGGIEHLLPAVYHGDPLSTEGVLCFQDFGWDLVDDLGAAGFREVEVITCWAPAFGYLGVCQPFIVGRR